MSVLSSTVTYCYKGCLRNARIVQVAIVVVCASRRPRAAPTFDASGDTLVAEGDPGSPITRAWSTASAKRSSWCSPISPATARCSPAKCSTNSRPSSPTSASGRCARSLRSSMRRCSAACRSACRTGERLPHAAQRRCDQGCAGRTADQPAARSRVHRWADDRAPRGPRGRRRARRPPHARRDARGHALGEVQASALADAEARWRDAKEQNKIERAALIAELRAVRDEHAGGADIFIGGCPWSPPTSSTSSAETC